MEQSGTMAKHIDIGKLGEMLAADQLVQQGYVIIGQNYSKKYGEIDIIAKYQGVIHFVEVKTVSYEVIIPYEQVSLQQHSEKR